MSHQHTTRLDRLGGVRNLITLYVAILVGQLITIGVLIVAGAAMSGTVQIVNAEELVALVLIALVFTPGPFIVIMSARWTGRL